MPSSKGKAKRPSDRKPENPREPKNPEEVLAWLQTNAEHIWEMLQDYGAHRPPVPVTDLRYALWLSDVRRLRWFMNVVKACVSEGSTKNLPQLLGLKARRGRPVDPNKSKNLDLAEKALTLRMQGKTWDEINKRLFVRANPPDERYIRTIVDRYQAVVMEKWRGELRRRWIAGSEKREKESFLKNADKGKNPDR
jgi:hypothetical protein